MSVNFGGFDEGFGVMGTLFPIAFVLVLALIMATIIRGVVQWNRNNRSPRLTVYARVVAKREDVSHHRHANAGDITGAHGYYTTGSTTYYATFEVDSGDRMELALSGEAYGQLAEGDGGYLTFQGTRYLDFVRE